MYNRELIHLMQAYQARTEKSQAECSRMAGVSTQTWNSIKNGYQSPRPETEAKILALVGRKGGATQ